MKKLGTLYGVDLLLDTDDEKILKFAEGHFEYQRQRLEKLSDWEMELQMAELKKKPYERFLILLAIIGIILGIILLN